MNATVSMQTYARNYLEERRRLGFGMRGMDCAVMGLARYRDEQGERPVTLESLADWARRLKQVRRFLRSLQQFEPETEVPDDTLFGRVGQRVTPHIFSEAELVDLLAAARRLGPAPGLRGATYEALFGLRAATGLRFSEAGHLRNADVDLGRGLLTIRQTKFAKSRQVPLHPRAVEALKQYRQFRDGLVEVADDGPFFVGSRGRGQDLSLRPVNRVFNQLRDQLGWVNRGTHRDGPRVHDLRHTFVVRRMPLWQAEGVDAHQAMLALSTYVGHAMITSTCRYLTDVPERMAVAAERFEAFAPVQGGSHA
jgi:integrase